MFTFTTIIKPELLIWYENLKKANFKKSIYKLIKKYGRDVISHLSLSRHESVFFQFLSSSNFNCIVLFCRHNGRSNLIPLFFVIVLKMKVTIEIS